MNLKSEFQFWFGKNEIRNKIFLISDFVFLKSEKYKKIFFWLGEVRKYFENIFSEKTKSEFQIPVCRPYLMHTPGESRDYISL